MTNLRTDSSIHELADLFRLLGDPTRLRIVLACLHGPVAVGDLAAQLDLSGSLVSHHLRLLRAARIVKADRQGKQVFYAAADQHISSVLTDMLEHIAEPEPDSEP
jgi:ArsR family transcriptional regulator, lead/cadmium/zinc/bismuth-responsive transcriptional repressor